MPTTPAPSEKIATATGQPAAVRSNIQRVAGSVHASPTMNEIEKRRLRSFPAMSSNQSAMPTRVSGHQPHGGRPAAMSRPAGMARRWGGSSRDAGREECAGGLVETRMSVRCATVGRIRHGRQDRTRGAIPTDNRSLRRAASVGGSDPLAADRPGLGAAFAPQGTGHRVLPPGIDVDRIQVDEPREVPLGDTVPGGLVELVGASVRA